MYRSARPRCGHVSIHLTSLYAGIEVGSAGDGTRTSHTANGFAHHQLVVHRLWKFYFSCAWNRKTGSYFGAVTVTKLAPQALLGAQRPGKTGENWVATQKSQNRKWPSERFSLLHLLRRFLGCLSAPADLVLASFFRFLKDFTLCMHIQASP